MTQEMKIELHSKSCSCRGGSWVLPENASTSRCPGGGASEGEKRVIAFSEWKTMGKPASLEEYVEIQERLRSGERREFQRYEVDLPVKLGRISSWRNPSAQAEETRAEVIAKGGALVRSRMAVERGEMLVFQIGEAYRTRAEVMYVADGTGPGMDGIQRLGLRFLDSPVPDAVIPSEARPLP